MNTFKTLLALAALAGSAYAVYMSIFEHPNNLPPEQTAGELGFVPPTFNGPTVGPAPMPSFPGDGSSSPPNAPQSWGVGGHAPNPDGTAPGYSDPYATASPYSAPGMNDAATAAAPGRGAYADPFNNAAPLPNPNETAAAAPNGWGDRNVPWSGDPGDAPNLAARGAPTTPEMTPLERPSRGAASTEPVVEAEPNLAAVAQGHLDNNRLDEALKLLSGYYDWEPGTALPPEDHEVLIDLLDQLAGTVIYSRQPWAPTIEHQVQPGETLEQIAQANHVPAGLIAKVNGVSPATLQPGAALKIIPGPFDAVVDLQQQRLTLRVNGLYAGRFKIGLGQNAPQTPGEFVVRDKIENPSYAGPTGPIAAGAPGNPLGGKWIDLGQGLAIHAMADEAQVPGVGGAGCVRVSGRDADDLFDILSIGSRIIFQAGAAAAPLAPANPSTVAGAPGYPAAAAPASSDPAGYSMPAGYTAPPGYSAPPGFSAPPGNAAPPMVSERPFGATGDLR